VAAVTEAGAAISETEARFDARRRALGVVLAPVVFASLWWLPMPSLEPRAHALAAVAAAVVVLWVTEAIPLAISALLGPALAVVCGVATPKAAFAPIADPLIFLFLGGFLLAAALARQGIDRRAALWLLARPFVAGAPSRALAAMAVITFAFSMWISNTATTAMLLPVALGLHSTMRDALGDHPERQRRLDRFTGGMCLCVAYAASLGGVATPIGTGPNVIAIGMLEEERGGRIDFITWMGFALPTALVMLALLLAIARRRFEPPVERIDGLQAEVQRQFAALGPMRAGERRALAVFGLAVLGWLAPSLLKLALGTDHVATQWADATLDEGVVAIACASFAFFVPSGEAAPTGERWAPRPRLVEWSDAQSLDWGSLVLLGGGLAVGKLMFDTGLAEAMGRGVIGLAGPLASQPLGLLVSAALLMLVLTEVTSNTAATSMMLPVVIGIARAGGMDPVPTAVCVTMAASFAFMLPVSTPPNAMAYGTRLVRVDAMLAIGVRLDLAGLVVLGLAGALLVPLVL
jgi:sodium-dependent dicarboxylate transporter 2/3/5